VDYELCGDAAAPQSPAMTLTRTLPRPVARTRAAVSRRQPRADDLVAVPAMLARLAERQAGVVTRRALADAGIGKGHVAAAVQARRWRAVGRHVVVLHNGELSPRQQAWVAVLLPDKPAGLAGLSAASAAGLHGFEPDEVHVLVAHDTHVRTPAWIRVHESRRFRPDDLLVAGGPPRTSPARSLIDAATWSARPRRACAILCAGVQQRVVRAERLISELGQAGPVRHVAIMREILGDISGGGHTLAEIDLGPLGVRAGLGAPRRQALRKEPSGKIRYVDAEFDLPDGSTLIVEIDGAVHLQPASWWDDQWRQNELVIGRQAVLRFPSLVLRLEPRRVVDQLRRIHLAHS
jgi:hypothetical protein